MKLRRRTMFLVFVFFALRLHAAVGCDLNDPDRDVKRLFPESTGYKTLYVSISKKGGETLLRDIERRLGDTFKGLFETADVPYTMYQIYQGERLIGYIHGVNQKGTFGGIQVFLALDLEGKIRSFYFQKLTSRAAKLFREPKFGEQFVGLTLKDFYAYDVASGKETPPGKINRIVNPAPEAESDFRAALRAAKKNLILVDEFLLGNKYLQFFKISTQERISKRGRVTAGAGSRPKPPVAEGGPISDGGNRRNWFPGSGGKGRRPAPIVIIQNEML